MLLFKKPLIIFYFLLIGSSIVSGQGKFGQIQGVISDSTTKQPLFGASVIIQGTAMGAATDLDGNYKLSQISPGRYTIIISYIGYKEKSIAVVVDAGVTRKLYVALQSVALEGQEIVVTAQASGQKQAINEQLTSNTIINVVSSEKIQQLPDDNAATALSRLPGVSLMNGDQVVIRGVQAKMNQILINGIELPSTDMTDRASDLGFISSNLLSGIEVTKVLTPDMDANTAGGTVNLRLREAPTGIHFDVLAQGNYNSSDYTTDNYKYWGSVSDRFFNDKFGVFLQGSMDRSDGGNQSASITPEINGSAGTVYGQAVYQTGGANFEYDDDVVKTAGGSFILDYKLPDGKIVFQNTYSGQVTDQRNNIVQLSFDNTTANYTQDYDLYGKDLWINALQAENTFGDIKVEASLSHSATEQYTLFADQATGPGNQWDEFMNQSQIIAPFGFNSQGNKITYNSAQAEQAMTLQKTFPIFDNINRADIDSAEIAGWTGAYNNQFYQHLYNASFDVTAPLNISNDITAIFKAGAKYIRTTRENVYTEYFAHGPSDLYNPNDLASINFFPGTQLSPANQLHLTQILQNNFTRGQNFLSDEYNFKNGFTEVINSDVYSDWLQKDMAGWSSPLQEADSWKNNWNGAEQFTAGYLMGTFNFSQKLTLLGGVRYESYNMIYHANFTYVIQSIYGNAITTQYGSIMDSTNPVSLLHEVPSNYFNVDRTDNNFFPNLQLKYNVNDWSDIRIAYSTGISRPDYLSIIPKIAVYPDADYELGNPTLRPTKAQNFDVVGSIYSNIVGLLTIDAYYKQLKDVMFNTQIYYGNLADYAGNINLPNSAFFAQRFGYTTRAQDIVNTSLNNPNPGYIRGVEIDWQTSFWYLPFPFNLVVLDANYTKSGSNMAYQVIQNNPVTVRQPNGKLQTVYQTTDTVYVGRLIQQANDVVNVALGVDYKGFSGRMSFNMLGNVLDNVALRPEESVYTGNIYNWAFLLKQDLPVNGLSIGVNGLNIFHNAVRTYQNYRMGPTLPITHNEVSVLYSPTTFQANLRYSF